MESAGDKRSQRPSWHFLASLTLLASHPASSSHQNTAGGGSRLHFLLAYSTMTDARPPSSGDHQVHQATLPNTEMNDLKKDISHVERVLSPSDKDAVDQTRIDNELQEYANLGRVEIDEATSRKLRRKIDRRVLVIMILTYFLQALDKGTMSFASIMGIREDTNLHGQQVCILGQYVRK